MDFGMFLEFQPRPEQAVDDTFREGLALVDAAESWGLDAAWLAEFHFSPQRSVLSSPIVLAGAIAGRTKRLRVGMAVYVLPLTHPLRIAEEIATLDQISNGRLEVGIGRSGFTNFYQGYGIPYTESQARFEEALDILRKAWTGEVFSHAGQFYAVRDVQITPPPHQRPHPPLRIAAASAGTFARIGSQGLPIFVGLRGDGTAELAANLRAYRDAWASAGHPGNGSVLLRVPVYVGDSEDKAHEEARASLTHYFDRQSRLVAADAARRSANTPGGDEKRETAAKLAALSYSDIVASRVAIGSPRGLVDRFTQLNEELGLDGIVAELNAGGLLDEATVLASLRRLTGEVMPAFK